MIKPETKPAIQQQSPVLTFVSEDSVTLKVGPVRHPDIDKPRQAPEEEVIEVDKEKKMEPEPDGDSNVDVLPPKTSSKTRNPELEEQKGSENKSLKSVDEVKDLPDEVSISNASTVASEESKSTTTPDSDKREFDKDSGCKNVGFKKEDVSLASLLLSKEGHKGLLSSVSTLTQAKTDVSTNISKPSVASSSTTLKPTLSASSNTSMHSSGKVPINTLRPFSQILKPSGPTILSNKGAGETDAEKELKSPTVPLFRLGMEGDYREYLNQYTTNTFALNKHQHMEHRDKRRAVVNKFSVNEFKWHNGEVYGNKGVVLNTLRYSIIALENAIPTAFMHPAWPIQRTTWVRAVQLASTPHEFSVILSFLEEFIKPICYVSVWNEAAGHMELHRITTADSRKRSKKSNKEEEEEEEEMEELNRELGLKILCFSE